MTTAALSTINICTLVAMINKSDKVTRSADKEAAIGRLTSACEAVFGDKKGRKLLASLLVTSKMDDAKAFVETAFEEKGEEAPAAPTSEEKPAKVAKPKKPKTEKGVTSGNGKRVSSMIGKTIKPLVERNTRRADTHGFKSLGIILNNPGIEVSDFVKKGGRLNDLRWDIAHKNVKLEG